MRVLHKLARVTRTILNNIELRELRKVGTKCKGSMFSFLAAAYETIIRDSDDEDQDDEEAEDDEDDEEDNDEEHDGSTSRYEISIFILFLPKLIHPQTVVSVGPNH